MVSFRSVQIPIPFTWFGFPGLTGFSQLRWLMEMASWVENIVFVLVFRFPYLPLEFELGKLGSIVLQPFYDCSRLSLRQSFQFGLLELISWTTWDGKYWGKKQNKFFESISLVQWQVTKLDIEVDWSTNGVPMWIGLLNLLSIIFKLWSSLLFSRGPVYRH